MTNNEKTFGGDTGNVFISIEVYRCVSVCTCMRWVTQSCLTLCSPIDCSLLGSSVHGDLQASILEWVAMLSSRGSSQPGIEPRSPALQLDSLPSEPPRKPKNTELGSLSFLWGIFPTHESSQDPLQCKWILYQLSYQRSPEVCRHCWPNPSILPALNMWCSHFAIMQENSREKI